jgi:hypothetical protein
MSSLMSVGCMNLTIIASTTINGASLRFLAMGSTPSCQAQVPSSPPLSLRAHDLL